MGRDARNEKRKITAALLNSLAVAVFVWSVIGPAFALAERNVLAWVGGMALAAALHFAARLLVGRVED